MNAERSEAAFWTAARKPIASAMANAVPLPTLFLERRRRDSNLDPTTDWQYHQGMRTRTLAAITALLGLASNAPAEPAARTYHVSRAAGDPDLMRVFNQVAAIEQSSGAKPASFEVVAKIDDSTYIVWPRKTRMAYGSTDRLSQIGGNVGRTLVPTETYTDRAIYYWLALPKKVDAADGEMLNNIAAIETTQTKTWNEITARVLKVAEPKRFTREDFLAKLKSGGRWVLPGFGSKPCTACGGDGKLSVMEKHAKCNACNGKGSFPETWTVQW